MTRTDPRVTPNVGSIVARALYLIQTLCRIGDVLTEESRLGTPSQGWKTFLNDHAAGIAAMDLFVVPTISFRLLYGLLIMGHGRRQILWFGVTSHPTAEWMANQITEACGWEQAPQYLIRDRDGAYGEVFIRRLRSMAFAIDQRRRGHLGKTDMLNG
jgi:hypothetical protein